MSSHGVSRRPKALSALFSLALLTSARPGATQSLALGSPAPALDVRAWVHGPPVRIGRSAARLVAVVEFGSPGAQDRWSRSSALSSLLQRHRDEVAVARVADDRAAIEEAVAEFGSRLGYSWAEDRAGATADAYAIERRPTYFVVDPNGDLAWIGHTTPELEDVVIDITAGTYDAEFAKARARCAERIALALRHKTWQGLIRIAGDLRKLRPRHAYPHTLVVQAYHDAKRDDDLARQAVEQAIEELADDPLQLGAFVHDALMPAGAFGEAFRGALLGPLSDVTVRAPLRRKLLAAQFWLLAPTRPADAAGRAALWLECVKGDADQCLHVGRELIRLTPKSSLLHLARQALDLGLRADPHHRELHLELFDLLAHQLHDHDGATQVGKTMVRRIGHDATWLNSFSWRLMTLPETQDTFAELALFAADRMTELPGWETYHRLDTLALAKFENGLIDDAIQLQAKALSQCAPSAKARYQERLDRYRAAKR